MSCSKFTFQCDSICRYKGSDCVLCGNRMHQRRKADVHSTMFCKETSNWQELHPTHIFIYKLSKTVLNAYPKSPNIFAWRDAGHDAYMFMCKNETFLFIIEKSVQHICLYINLHSENSDRSLTNVCRPNTDCFKLVLFCLFNLMFNVY